MAGQQWQQGGEATTPAATTFLCFFLGAVRMCVSLSGDAHLPEKSKFQEHYNICKTQKL